MLEKVKDIAINVVSSRNAIAIGIIEKNKIPREDIARVVDPRRTRLGSFSAPVARLFVPNICIDSARTEAKQQSDCENRRPTEDVSLIPSRDRNDAL